MGGHAASGPRGHGNLSGAVMTGSWYEMAPNPAPSGPADEAKRIIMNPLQGDASIEIITFNWDFDAKVLETFENISLNRKPVPVPVQVQMAVIVKPSGKDGWWILEFLFPHEVLIKETLHLTYGPEGRSLGQFGALTWNHCEPEKLTSVDQISVPRKSYVTFIDQERFNVFLMRDFEDRTKEKTNTRVCVRIGGQCFVCNFNIVMDYEKTFWIAMLTQDKYFVVQVNSQDLPADATVEFILVELEDGTRFVMKNAAETKREILSRPSAASIAGHNVLQKAAIEKKTWLFYRKCPFIDRGRYKCVGLEIYYSAVYKHKTKNKLEVFSVGDASIKALPNILMSIKTDFDFDNMWQ